MTQKNQLNEGNNHVLKTPISIIEVISANLFSCNNTKFKYMNYFIFHITYAVQFLCIPNR